MKKLPLVGLALLAVCAFSALAAATASAEEALFLLALWLFNGSAVTNELPVIATGELTLEDLAAIGGAAAVLCSGILKGWVGPNSTDLITDVLRLDGTTLIAAALVAPAITGCTILKGACVNEVEVWPLKLPWPTELELHATTGRYYILILNKPGWYILCLGAFGIEATDSCEAPEEGVAEAVNGAATLEASFSEAITLAVGLPNATCSQGGAGTGVVTSDAPGIVEDETAPARPIQASSE